MFEKVKKFVKNHKKELIIGGCLMLAGFGGGYYIYQKYGKKEPPVQANFVVSRYVTNNLPKPDWGIHYDIQEHWKDGESQCPMMILDTYLPCLGELGEKLMSDCCANQIINMMHVFNTIEEKEKPEIVEPNEDEETVDTDAIRDALKETTHDQKTV